MKQHRTAPAAAGMIAGVLLFGGCAGSQEPAADTAPEPRVNLRRVLTDGLESPWEITWGPDDRLWVTERAGKRVVRVDPDTGDRTVALEIPDTYQSFAQDGVLGMALDPMLGSGSDQVWIMSTYDAAPGPDAVPRGRVQRYVWDRDAETLTDPMTVIDGLPVHNDHVAGRLVLGPDRMLYLSVGDMGSNFGRNRCNLNLAQVLPTAAEITAGDWSHYAGKILRIGLDGSIPADNPEIDGVRSHVFSYGHRNPQGLVFDAEGNLFESEHGPSTDDEVNRIEAGGNYGWPQVAGYQDDQAYAYEVWARSSPTPCAELTGQGVPDSVPVEAETEWSHPDFRPPLETFFTVGNDYSFQENGTATVAASGLDIYIETDGIPGWADSLLLASLSRGVIYRIALSSDHQLAIGGPTQELYSTNRYRDLAIRPGGRTIYVLADDSGGTRDPDGERTGMLANPGSILEFELVE